jgi:hypothetical protein
MKNIPGRIITHVKTFARALDGLKYNRRAVYWIIAIDLALGLSSTVVDWGWLIRVPPHLVMFAPICSLYPWLLAVWFSLYLWKRKIPAWFTAFLFAGLFSYGIMAWIYFPLYMSWNGINFHDVGSMFWVAGYALQAFIIASELKKLPLHQFTLIMGYFFFKDYADRYLGTFLDVLLDSYPEQLKTIFFTSALALHAAAAGLLLYLPHQKGAPAAHGARANTPASDEVRVGASSPRAE